MSVTRPLTLSRDSTTNEALNDVYDRSVETGLVGISKEHQRIHEGSAYSLGVNLSIQTSDIGAISITPGTGVNVHLKSLSFAALGGPVTISLLEEYTFGSGSTLTPMNRNRTGTQNVSSAACEGSADATVTYVSGAPIQTLDTMYIPTSTVGDLMFGYGSATDLEWILKPDTKYVIAITNGAIGTSVVQCNMFWYEQEA